MTTPFNSNLDNIKKQVSDWQKKFATVVVSGKAGEINQEVTVKISGSYRVLEVTVAPALLSPDRANQINESAAKAFDQALRALEAKMQEIFLKTSQENG